MLLAVLVFLWRVRSWCFMVERERDIGSAMPLKHNGMKFLIGKVVPGAGRRFVLSFIFPNTTGMRTSIELSQERLSY